MSNKNEQPTINAREPDISLTDILKAVQTGQHEARKAHDRDVTRFERLTKQIGELGNRINTIDQSIQHALSAFLPVNTQLRVSSQTRTDSNPSLPLSVIQPEAQKQPGQDQQVPPAAPVNTPIDDEEPETRPRRNPARKKSSATKEHPSTSTKQEPAQTSKQGVKPGYDWKNTAEKRALPPSPPRIGKARPSKATANRPATSSAREQPEGASSDDGVDEIPAVAEESKAKKNSKKRKPKRVKTTGGREAAHDFDDGEASLGMNGSSDNEALAQTANPSKKRKTSRPDPVGDAEDDEDEQQRPRKKVKKSQQAE